jgi:hypothetical protein
MNQNPALRTVMSALLTLSALSAAHGQEPKTSFSEKDIRGVWTYSAWVEATLLIPLPAEMTHFTPPSQIVSPGDKVTVKGTLIGLFEFDGKGNVTSFQDLFKAGSVEPLGGFPLPYLPALPEQGSGSYTVSSDGMVEIKLTGLNPDTQNLAGETDYACVLNRSPRQLDCMFGRFKTFAVDPSGFDAPIAGQATLRPQR